MFKSITVSVFTSADNSLLICGFHITMKDFLLAIRLLSEGKLFSLHVNIHGLWWLSAF